MTGPRGMERFWKFTSAGGEGLEGGLESWWAGVGRGAAVVMVEVLGLELDCGQEVL